MKKILGISLCALFAVSAANANIASTEWVQEQIGGIDTSGIGVNADNIAANATAIEGLTTRVTANESAIGTNTTKIQTNAGDINALDGRVTQNTTDIGTNTTKINNLNTAIQGMNQTQTTGQYVKYVKQENGDVTAEGESFDTSVSDTSESTIAPTSKAVATYVKGKVDGLGVPALAGRVTANEGAITALQTSTTGLAALAYKNTVATADIDANAVTSAQIANDAVTSAQIDDETITNDDISGTAAIATSKIAFSDDEKAALGSTITVAKVDQIETNKTNITSLQTTVSQHNQALKPSSECIDNADGCTLVYRNNAYSWEKITREAQ